MATLARQFDDSIHNVDCAKDLYLELCKEFSGFARDKKIKRSAKQRTQRNT